MLNGFYFYMEYRNSLDNLYNGKFILIINRKVAGVFDNQLQAYHEGLSKYEPYSFWVQRCEASCL
jgi:hypothetical protein